MQWLQWFGAFACRRRLRNTYLPAFRRGVIQVIKEFKPKMTINKGSVDNLYIDEVLIHHTSFTNGHIVNE
jgi:hypothetical protein